MDGVVGGLALSFQNRSAVSIDKADELGLFITARALELMMTHRLTW